MSEPFKYEKSLLFFSRRGEVKNYNFRNLIFMLAIGFVVTGCGSDDTSASNIVACDLPNDQCFEWINLTDQLVVSLSATCVNPDGGVIIDSCPTENLIGICEELDDPGGAPDLLNHFYSDPSQAGVKEQACIDAGGIWVSKI